MHDRTHASFFSGVGGLDLGLERAGWRTVSFSGIDPYASAVLAERWPGVPNLGSIVDLAGDLHLQGPVFRRDGADDRSGRGNERIPAATLWTGGFPCQDLSVAGKRRGMVEGTRSGLAYSFLALAERHRPRFVLLENVPGLLSSHGGRDMAALLGALVELGYGVGYRVLDARYFGVPQRRRRVFILGDSLGGRAGAERASEVLSIGSRCRRHPPTGIEAGEGTAAGATPGVDIARPVVGTAGKRHVDDTDTLISFDPTAGLGQRIYSDGTTPGLKVGSGIGLGWSPAVYAGPPDDARGQGRRRQGSTGIGGHEPDDGHQPDADAVRRAERPSPDPRGVRATDGLAGWLDDRGDVVNALDQRRGGADDNEAQAGHLVTGFMPYRTLEADGSITSGFAERDIADALHGPTGNKEPLVAGDFAPADDLLLPQGLDSHRYRCCGNGVVSDVAEWIGYRLAALA
jgi:site-specific DNA-cytosine methylase